MMESHTRSGVPKKEEQISSEYQHLSAFSAAVIGIGDHMMHAYERYLSVDSLLSIYYGGFGWRIYPALLTIKSPVPRGLDLGLDRWQLGGVLDSHELDLIGT